MNPSLLPLRIMRISVFLNSWSMAICSEEGREGSDSAAYGNSSKTKRIGSDEDFARLATKAKASDHDSNAPVVAGKSKNR